jgi:hypothetical protein
METKIKKFAERNAGSEPYNDLRYSIVEFYPKLKIDFKTVPASLIEKIKKDMEMFREIEKNRLAIDRPLVGDYIHRKDGRLTKIGMFTYNGKFQDTNGGSFYVGPSGNGSYSGGFTMDVIETKNLQYTGETRPLYVWTFSEGWAGGNRGVYEYINVKVWREI